MERYRDGIDKLESCVLDGPAGRLEPDVRRAAARRGGGELPEALEALVDKLHGDATRISDRDIDELLKAGYSEDEIFEVVVSGAVGAGLRRLDAATRAIAEDRARRAG